jgi:hypothetical protein
MANYARPRLRLLVDSSLSMPASYRDQALTPFMEELTKELRAIQPKVEIELETTGSDLWRNLRLASRADPSFIVYLTDGDVDDSAPDANGMAELAAGPQALIIGVRDRRRDVFTAMAEATGGQWTLADDPAATRKAIADLLASHDEPSYRFRYSAPSTDAGERAVVVSVGAATENGSYTAPEADAAALAPALAGLYLTVGEGRDSVTRTIAGRDHRNPKAAPTPADIAAVRAQLFGTCLLAVEGPAPTTSVILDDLISSRLSVAEAEATAKDPDRPADEALTALLDGFRYLPADLTQTVQAPLDQEVGPSHRVWHDGLRLAIYRERAIWGSESVFSAVDLLPLTKVRAIADDPATACRKALGATAPWTLAESARFQTSTLGALEGRPWAVISPDHPAITALHGEERADWYRRFRGPSNRWLIGDAEAKSSALLQVNRMTGELLALLEDDTGGGQRSEDLRKAREIKELIDENVAVMGHLNAMLGLAGASIGIGLYVNYGQLVARLYGAVALVITVMDAGGLEESLRKAILEFACNAKKTIFFGVMGRPGAIAGGIDDLIGTLIEDNPFACPSG